MATPQRLPPLDPVADYYNWSGWGNSSQRGSSELFLLGRRRKWTIYVLTRSMSWGVEDTTASILGLFAGFLGFGIPPRPFFFVRDTGHWSLRYSVVFLRVGVLQARYGRILTAFDQVTQKICVICVHVLYIISMCFGEDESMTGPWSGLSVLELCIIFCIAARCNIALKMPV